jgi:hypothetical protein
MTKTIKAERVVIELGSSPINVYQLPDGSYRLSGRNVTDAIEEDDKTLPRFYGVKSLKDLPGACLESGKISAGKEGSPFIPVEIKDAAVYWGHCSQKGNALASAILVACAIESIERRADKAFGKTRSEEEYNDRMKARIEGMVVRRSLCDVIKEYILRHPELSENTTKWLYKNTTDAIYKAIFDRTKKKLAEDLKAEDPKKFRNSLNAKELKEVERMEETVMRLIEDCDTHPLEAVVEAAKRTLVRKSDRIAEAA